MTSNMLEIALSEGNPDAAKSVIRGMTSTTTSTTTLYLPVLRAFDSREAVLSILREVHGNLDVQWPSKHHDIALLAAYFADPEFALAVKAREARNTPVRLGALWHPVMSDVRKLPAFKELVTEINLVKYWRTYGWADACKPLSDDDFTCS